MACRGMRLGVVRRMSVGNRERREGMSPLCRHGAGREGTKFPGEAEACEGAIHGTRPREPHLWPEAVAGNLSLSAVARERRDPSGWGEPGLCPTGYRAQIRTLSATPG